MIHWIAIAYLSGLAIGFFGGAWFGFNVAHDERKQNGRSQGPA